MRFFAISFLSALAATVSAATTTPDYSQGPSGNPIALPGLNDQVPVGQPYQIKWQPTTAGDVSIWLLRGPSNNVQPIATLASNIPNSGEFTWTPSTSLQDDVTHYGLIIIVEGTGQYQYSTQFGIKNDAVAAGTASAAVASTSAAAVKTTTAAPVTSSSSVVESTTASSTEITEATVKTAIKSTATTSAPAETTQTTAATPAVPPSNSAAASPSTVTQAASSSTPLTPTTFSSSTISTPTNSQSSSSPTPTFTGGADRKTAGLGAIAVAAGLMAIFAF